MAPSSRNTIPRLMAPSPGFMAVCVGVGTVATAVAGVKEIVKDAKQFLETVFHDKCDECGEMIKRSDLETHLQKHREDEEKRKLEEEKKKQEEEKKKQEEDRKKLEQNFEELNRKILKIQIEMQEKDLAVQQRELRHQAELETLKAIMEITCRLCGQIVPARLLDAHLSWHGRERSDIRRKEDEKAAMRQDQHRKGPHRRHK